jgi:hypothetical protein
VTEEEREVGRIRIRAASWLAWSVCSLSTGLLALAVVLRFLSRHAALPPEFGTLWGTIVGVISILALPVLGALIASRRPENPIGWLLCVMGLGFAVDYAAEGYAIYALVAQSGAVVGGLLAAWVTNWVWSLGLGLLPFVFLLFPTGRLHSGRWRPVAWFGAALYVTLPFGYALLPGPLGSFPFVENPLGYGGTAGEILPGMNQVFAWTALLLTFLASVVSLVLRFKRSRGEERQQLKWIAYAAMLLVSYGVIDFFFQAVLTPVAPLLDAIVSGGLWAAIAVAILKYRLYDVDFLINRTLVYGALTATLVAIYLGGIVTLQWLFVALTGQRSTLAVVASTLLIAALFSPLRRRIQGFIDRRFYRRKYDARKTLDAFSARLRDETDLDVLNDALVGVARETMQPAHVSLWLRAEKTYKAEQANQLLH